MIYGGRSHQDFDWRSWQPDEAALKDLLRAGGYYNANDPDLSAFKAGGGKLIMWQGEADNAGGSYLLLDYYQRVRDAMGLCRDRSVHAGLYASGRIPLHRRLYCLSARHAWARCELGGARNIARSGGRHRRAGRWSDAPPPGLSYPVRAQYGAGDINAADSSVRRQRRACPTIISIGGGGHHRRQTAVGLILFRPIK
jgi:feruloyl esterase